MINIIRFASVAMVLGAASLQAQTIDSWEPIQTGSGVPTFASASDDGRIQLIGYGDGSVRLGYSAPASGWMSLNVFGNGIYLDTIHFNGTPVSGAVFMGPIWWSGFYATRSRNGGNLIQVGQGVNGPAWHSDLTPTLPARDILGVSGVGESSIILLSNGRAWYGNIGYPGTVWSSTPLAAHQPYVPPTGSQVSVVEIVRADWTAPVSKALVGTLTGEIWLVNQPGTASASWRRLDRNPGQILPVAQVNRLQFDRRDPTGKSMLAVLHTNATPSIPSTWVSRDAGLTWSALNEAVTTTGQPTQLITASFTLAPNSPNSFYGTTANLPSDILGMRSDDAGKSWFWTPRWSGSNIAVEYRHYDNALVGNQLYPTVRLRNLNSVPVKLEGLNLKYYFSADGSAPTTYYYDYSPYGSGAVQGSALNGTLTLALHGQNQIASGEASGEFVGRVAKSDWSNFDQGNDISYMASATSWTINNRTQLFLGDARIWGASQPR